VTIISRREALTTMPARSLSNRIVSLRAVAVVLAFAAFSSACGSPGHSASVTVPAGETADSDPGAASKTDTASGADTDINTGTETGAAVTTLPGSTADASPAESPWPSDPRSSEVVKRWTVDVVGSIAHDPGAYTQGLELADGVLYESDGLYGESSIRTADSATGEVISKVDIDPAVFGEGLTIVGDEVVQITWREGRAFRHDRTTLELLGEWAYDGEGWGLCLMGDHLLMTDGSEQLTSRSPDDFSALSSVSVTLDGQPVTYLNELECIGDLVVANIYTTTNLVVINPVDGRVVATIDASALLERVTGRIGTDPGNVLNGVADLGDGTLLMAGKRWPESFVVRLVEQ